MRTILVDDELIALEVLEYMLSPYEEINIVGSYTRYGEALEDIKEIDPDVIFLDIELGDMNGLELAEIIMGELDNVEIVFVTAYSKYAVDAFEINAIDYLLKPIQEKRLAKAIERLKEKIEEKEKSDKEINISNNKLEVRSFGGFQVVDRQGNLLTWRTQKAKELFAYLWDKKQRPVSKRSIMKAIFSDREEDKGSTLLHTTVYQLRKALEGLGYLNGISYFDESYQLNIPSTSDRGKLNKIINSGRYREEDIIEILQIYRGDFMEEGYPWARELQQNYKELVMKILEKFVRDNVKNGKFHLNVKVALDKAYEIDPLNEGVAEIMIHYYGSQNKRSSLEIFFNNYSERLWNEMELKPMANTINAYKRYMESL